MSSFRISKLFGICIKITIDGIGIGIKTVSWNRNNWCGIIPRSGSNKC